MLVSLFTLALSLTGGDPTLEIIRAAQREAYEAIESISATMKPFPDQDPNSTSWIDWCQQDDRIRCAYLCKLDGLLTACDDAILLGDLNVYATSRPCEDSGSRFQGGIGPSLRANCQMRWALWNEALFLGFSEKYCLLSTYLEKEENIVSQARERIGDEEMIRLEFRSPLNEKAYYWLSPKHNYLTQRYEVFWPGDTSIGRSLTEVTSFHEVAPGYYFPAILRQTTHEEVESGEIVQSEDQRQIVIHSVNQPLPDETFERNYPRGTHFWNDFDGTANFRWGLNYPKTPAPRSSSSTDLPEPTPWRLAAVSCGLALLLPTSRARVRRFLPNRGAIPFLILGGSSVNFGCQEDGPRLSVEPPKVSIRVALNTETAEAGFSLRNPGTAPLIIQGLEDDVTLPGPGGDEPCPPTLTLAPGQVKAAKVTLELERSCYDQEFWVNFRTNDPRRAEVSVPILAILQTQYAAVPTGVSFGKLKVGETKRRTLRLRVNPDRVVDDRPMLEVTPSDIHIVSSRPMRESIENAGMMGSIDVHEIELAFTGKVPGPLDGLLKIQSRTEPLDKLEVHVEADVLPDIALVPSIIMLPRRSSAGLVTSKTIRCRQVDGAPFSLRASELPRGVHVTTADSPSGETTIGVTIDPATVAEGTHTVLFDVLGREPGATVALPLAINPALLPQGSASAR